MAENTARPLIVCGFGRSGTRMCANILANSNDVELQGEIPPALADQTFSFLINTKRDRARPDPDRDHMLARVVFREMAGKRSVTRNKALWFGHKTPHHERYFDSYERIFDQPDLRARYVYCVRNPFDVWRSHRNMPWAGFRDAGSFAKAWVRSVERYRVMRAAAPDRVMLFNLDAMLRAPDQMAFLNAAMLDALDLRPDSFRKPVGELENTNSSAAKLGGPPPEPPQKDRDRIARERGVKQALAEFFPWIDPAK